MQRLVMLAFLVVPLGLLAQAATPAGPQVKEIPKKAAPSPEPPGKQNEPPAPAATETVVKLTVTPMAPPTPSLRYQLLPEFREISSGNPIHAYLKCFAEQNNYFYGKESSENQQKWLEAPLEDLPDAVRGWTERGPMKRLDEAARLDNPDWGIIQELKRDGIYTLLPDLQILRNLAAWNRIRMRFEVKEKRFDDAIRSAKSMFQLARHMDENYTLIGDLVGLAIAMQGVLPLEEMIGQPGAPNLYWAWSFLPGPLIRYDRGVLAERAFVLIDLGDLIDPKRVWGEDDLVQAKEALRKLADGSSMPQGDRVRVEAWMFARLADKPFHAAVRKRLIGSGFPPDKVQRYTPEQLILHEMVYYYEVKRDELMKYMHAPFHQVQDRLLALDKRPDGEPTAEQILGRTMTPGLVRLRQAQARLEQRIGMLRVVEALRWHAATHDGKFPKTLAEFSEPLPDDPVTGQPYQYSSDGAAAELRCTPCKGFEKSAAYNVRYEIRLRK